MFLDSREKNRIFKSFDQRTSEAEPAEQLLLTGETKRNNFYKIVFYEV